MDAAQQRWVYQPTPERIDERKIRLRPGADREDVNRPEELIAISDRRQRPDEESVDCRVPDLGHCLRRMNVHDGERPIKSPRLHRRPLPIGFGEPPSIRPYFRLRHRIVPSKQTSKPSTQREEGSNRSVQRLRRPRGVEDGAHVLHGARGPAARKGNSPDVVQGHISQECVSTKREATVFLGGDSRPGALAHLTTLNPSPNKRTECSRSEVVGPPKHPKQSIATTPHSPSLWDPLRSIEGAWPSGSERDRDASLREA